MCGAGPEGARSTSGTLSQIDRAKEVAAYCLRVSEPPACGCSTHVCRRDGRPPLEDGDVLSALCGELPSWSSKRCPQQQVEHVPLLIERHHELC